MESEQTLATIAPDTAVATVTSSIETASPVGSKRAATGGRETKAKAPKKLPTKEEKCIEAAKRRGRRMNLKERMAVVT
jgi:hypothetical protein